jgi:hypothetical protein
MCPRAQIGYGQGTTGKLWWGHITQQCNLAQPTWEFKPRMPRDGAVLQLWKPSLEGILALLHVGGLLSPFCEMEYRETAVDCPARMTCSSCSFSQSGCLVLAFTRWVFSLEEQPPIFKWSPSPELLVIGSLRVWSWGPCGPLCLGFSVICLFK